MSERATTRAEKKLRSLEKILKVASIRLRDEGLKGAAIAPVMQEAGLTHGAFYSHFANKDELAQAAFLYALEKSQPHWLGHKRESWANRLKRLAASYLKPSHRDDRAHGCAVSALASYVPDASEDFQQTYSDAVAATLDKICDFEANQVSDAGEDLRLNVRQLDEAIAFLALCVGGLNLARAVKDPALSDKILDACKEQIARIAD